MTTNSSNRLMRLREQMQRQEVPALLITSPINRKYISGFTGSAGYVLVTEERAVLLTDFRYTTQASEQAPDFEIVDFSNRLMEHLGQYLSAAKLTKLAFEQEHISYAQYAQWSSQLTSVEWVPVQGLVETLRIIKDDSEITVIREAAELVDRTFSHIQSFLKPGVAERDIALEIEMYVRKSGAISTSFDTIVASGERSALPHGVASERLLGTGELVTLDFGAYWKGYCSDITRTVSLGTPPDILKEIYAIVLDAQQYALENLKPGMTGREADALARDRIVKAGYGEHFGHSTGHGLGMEIHEDPRLSMNSSTILQPGMVVTVEPGIYLPGVGGVRIEDDVLITDSGAERLTWSDKQLLIL
ncbi:M24 family metallopeptidase [Paenibacillus senegalensis]|uniref:M24 family metallopeptidase n=1 Tax=Paenibacillus senegalensis TaxID=1465766 RepID=UPI0002882D30|nr:Xaa-Pro peptidase family protein [Paenibacillus senegalensis]